MNGKQNIDVLGESEMSAVGQRSVQKNIAAKPSFFLQVSPTGQGDGHRRSLVGMIDGQFLWLVFEAAFDAHRDFSGRDVGVKRMSRERGMDLRAAGRWAFDGVSEGAAGGVAASGLMPSA